MHEASIRINYFESWNGIYYFIYFLGRQNHIGIHKAHNLMDSFSDVAGFCRKNNLPPRNVGVLFESGIWF